MVALADIIGRGDAASRPAAGTEGRLYYSTDTGVLERDNGAGWDSVEGTTGGIGGAPDDAAYVTTAASGSLSGEVLLSAVIGYGDTASRPAAGTAGRLYFDTDDSILYRDNGTTWDAAEGGSATGQASTLNFVIDGGGSAIATGIKGDLQVDFAATITGVTLLADQSGSIVVDVWLDSYANFPPTDADSITAAAPPTISAATKSQDAALTGWTTGIAAGGILRFNVDSVTDIQRCTVALTVERA